MVAVAVKERNTRAQKSDYRDENPTVQMKVVGSTGGGNSNFMVSGKGKFGGRQPTRGYAIHGHSIGGSVLAQT